MYSLFIGLTLGGVPLLLRMVRPALRPDVVLAALAGFAVMLLMAVLQPGGDGGGEPSWALAFLAGLAGAAAMTTVPSSTIEVRRSRSVVTSATAATNRG